MRPSRVVPALILCEHQGLSVRDPFDPVATWTGQVDLDALRIISSVDGSIDLPFPRYLVRRIALPAWLPAAIFLEKWQSWSDLWSTAARPTWPEAWQRYLVLQPLASAPGARFNVAHLTAPRRLALVELLATRRPPSRFHRSLREAVEAWLATWWRFEQGLDSEAPRFVSPLSNPQWQRLVRPHHQTESGRSGAERIYEIGVEITDDEAENALQSEAA
ncbi:MAG: hypothetical protein AAGD06_32345 [Acidobacteriota bacterium]